MIAGSFRTPLLLIIAKGKQAPAGKVGIGKQARYGDRKQDKPPEWKVGRALS